MYLGIDIGGTKTLVAALDDDGVIKEHRKFPTPKDYSEFSKHLAKTLEELETKDFKAAGVAIPDVFMDRESGVGESFGNLPWTDVPIKADVKKITDCPVVVENDAKLAGLSEAMLLKDEYQKVLYITISTGIGTALIVNQTIDSNFGDGGGRTFLVEHHGKEVPWESFASGHAIVKRYGKRAEDIHEAKIWHDVAHDIAIGLIDVIAMTEPEVIIIGGGVGQYLERFKKPLVEALKHYENPLLPIPPIRQAQRPAYAVVYGCYDLAKAVSGSQPVGATHG